MNSSAAILSFFLACAFMPSIMFAFSSVSNDYCELSVEFLNYVSPDTETQELDSSSEQSNSTAAYIYQLGAQLANEKKYAEADIILRYWLCAMIPSETHWRNKAIRILTSNRFYDYYARSEDAHMNWLSEALPDNLLIDKESVRRKYRLEGYDMKKEDDIWTFRDPVDSHIEISVTFRSRRIKHFRKKGPGIRMYIDRWCQ